jgi:hypothetical protein
VLWSTLQSLHSSTISATFEVFNIELINGMADGCLSDDFQQFVPEILRVVFLDKNYLA